MSALKLATENGKRVGRVAKAKRLAAEPATEAARLRRCISRIRVEAEAQQRRTQQVEDLLNTLLRVAHGGDPILFRAMAREAAIEVPAVISVNLVVRFCEMAEEGTLCA